MTNTSGSETGLIVIGDSDALIAFMYEDDHHFEVASRSLEELVRQKARLIFPVTAIAETMTTLQRRLNQPTLAAHIRDSVLQKVLDIASTDETLLNEAMLLYNAEGSKQNTLFDALVVATARHYNTRTIFSFDRWYKKLGFTLASELVGRGERAA